MFDRSVFQDLREADPNAGAKAVFTKHRLRIINVAVDDPGAFQDVDTPQEYDDLRSRIADC
jgi:CTP:molybdopterin cytidylyltransferase MocA